VCARVLSCAYLSIISSTSPFLSSSSSSFFSFLLLSCAYPRTFALYLIRDVADITSVCASARIICPMCASQYCEKSLAQMGQTHYWPVSLSHMHVMSSRHAGGEANQRQGGGFLRNINSDPHSVRARPFTGAVSGGHLRKPSPMVGPSHHVVEAMKLHAATTPRLCENVPTRLYQG
jgi:hypothetical protein